MMALRRPLAIGLRDCAPRRGRLHRPHAPAVQPQHGAARRRRFTAGGASGAGKPAESGGKAAFPIDRVRQKVAGGGRTPNQPPGVSVELAPANGWVRRGGKALSIVPVAAVVGGWAEERVWGTVAIRRRITAAAKWLFDGAGSEADQARAARHARCVAAAEAAGDPWSTLGGGPPTVLRRVAAWAVDGVLLIGARMAFQAALLPLQLLLSNGWLGALLSPTFATLAWSTRDQWLAAWGAQSPGRWLVRQEVVALQAPRAGPPAGAGGSSGGAGAAPQPLDIPPGDEEVWATICLNTAVAGAFRVLLPTATTLLTLGTELRVGVAPSRAGLVVATAGAVAQAGLVFSVVVALPVLTAVQLVIDPRGRLWTDRIANTQVLDQW